MISLQILIEELMMIYSILKVSNDTQFTIYTDGSMDMNVRNICNNIVMGSGWILPTKKLVFCTEFATISLSCDWRF